MGPAKFLCAASVALCPAKGVGRLYIITLVICFLCVILFSRKGTEERRR